MATLTLTAATACAEDDASIGATSTGPAVREAAPSAIAVDATTTVVDVRTAEEFAAGHLEGAVNIDVSAPDFEAQLAQLDPAATYIVYCHSGNRSAQATAAMAALGFAEVVDAGGIEHAAAATGLPITR
ncbi:rhodanese-like domain-containing protein [Nocardioides daeguensis]|nr:rhodanese-like domain-containing protein [Nocardioides daeguensis]MCR1773504.1 rhodanese-like domain-containing protein [Nocardioides daeguensis]